MGKSSDSARATAAKRFAIGRTAKKIGKFRAAAAIVMSNVMLLSGCALTDPYARWTAPELTEVAQQTDISLPYAIAYAQNARDAYRDKLSDHAIFTNSVAPALITLGAVVLALAAYGANTDAILGVGLAGGTAYSLANWYSNDTQELVYLAGMKAMSCAVGAVLPLNFSVAAKKSLKTDITSLSTAIDQVHQAAGTTVSWVSCVWKRRGTLFIYRLG